jgi:hypothetical protein
MEVHITYMFGEEGNIYNAWFFLLKLSHKRRKEVLDISGTYMNMFYIQLVLYSQNNTFLKK